MSTYIEVQNRINGDFMNRQLGAETRRAIQAAIRFYERRRWSFNQTATSIATSAGQTFVSLPSNFLILDDLRITLNGQAIPMHERDPQYIRDMNMTGVTGQPTDYAFTRNRLELAITPDAIYSLPLYYVKTLPELSADSDENYWTLGLTQDVIAYHAAKLLWATLLRNDREAAKYAALERDALMQVTSLVEQRVSPGSLKATTF